MADTPATENARKKLTEEREARARAATPHAGGKPTPTQDENDLIALGGSVELEADGSPETGPTGAPLEHHDKSMSAGRPAGYSTRQSTAAAAAHPKSSA